MQQLTGDQLKRFSAQEAKLINGVLAAHNLRGSYVRQVHPSRYDIIEYVIQRGPQIKNDHIRKVIEEVTEAITEFRLANGSFSLSDQTIPHVHVEVRSNPCRFTAATPQPIPISWEQTPIAKGKPLHALVGISTIAGQTNVVTINFSSDASPHTLVAGITGSGKSVMMSMIASSLCFSTPPSMLDVYIADPKNQEIAALAGLPQVKQLAVTQEEFMHMLIGIEGTLNQRMERFNGDEPTICLFIDELAEISNFGTEDRKQAVQILRRYTNLGRGVNMVSCMGTQKPTREELGGLGNMNFTVRLVGAVPTAASAHYISGRKGTNAHMQSNAGSFVMVHRNGFRGVKGFFIDTKRDLPKLVSYGKKKHGGSAANRLAAMEQEEANEREQISNPKPPQAPPAPAMPTALLSVFEDYWEAMSDDNKVAPRAGIIKQSHIALYGKEITGKRRASVNQEIYGWASMYLASKGLQAVRREEGNQRAIKLSESFLGSNQTIEV